MAVDIKPNKNTIYSALPMQVYMIHAVKMPLIEGVNTFLDPGANKLQKVRALRLVYKAIKAMAKLPEPTVESVWHPNTHKLIVLRDWFFERCFLGGARLSFVRTLFNFVIILYDFDPPWRWMIDSVIEKFRIMPWEDKNYGHKETPNWAWWQDEE